MAESVVIENVILQGADLNVVGSPWTAVNRANNWRLLPIAAGYLGLAFVMSFLIDPSFLELVALMAPLVLGGYGFIWATNVLYLRAYKKAYALTPVGGEPCTFTFNQNGMHQAMPRGTSSYRWSAFVEVVEDTRGVRLWMTPFMAVFIPTRFMDETQTAQLRDLIDAARIRGDLAGAPR